MKSVLHILPMDKLSGAEKMVLNICKNQKEHVSVVFVGGSELAGFFKSTNIKVYQASFSTRELPNLINRLRKVIYQEKIDIIHAHDNIASIVAVLTKSMLGNKVKVISHIHSCYPWLQKKNGLKIIDKIFRPRYDFNIMCGEIVYEYYKKNGINLKSEKTSVLSNAIETPIERIEKKDYEIANLKKRYSIPLDKKVIGFIGRLTEAKGLIPLIKELKNYIECFEDSIFILIGSGELEDEINRLLVDLGLEQNFLLLGFQENVQEFYRLIDIFFLPSIYEGLPMVLLEAMAAQCPVISMNVGSINELIIPNKTGILIESKNTKKFIEELLLFKEDISKQNEIKKEASEYIRYKYSIDNYMLRLNSIYSQL